MCVLICLITYAVYVQTLADFQPQNTYEVYDSLAGAQARILLPKKADPATTNSEICPRCYVSQPIDSLPGHLYCNKLHLASCLPLPNDAPISPHPLPILHHPSTALLTPLTVHMRDC